MLLEIEKDRNATISVYSTSHGHHFQTNGKDLNADGDARATAQWRDALKTLVRLGALEMRGQKGQVFALSAKGFRLVEALSALE